MRQTTIRTINEEKSAWEDSSFTDTINQTGDHSWTKLVLGANKDPTTSNETPKGLYRRVINKEITDKNGEDWLDKTRSYRDDISATKLQTVAALDAEEEDDEDEDLDHISEIYKLPGITM